MEGPKGKLILALKTVNKTGVVQKKNSTKSATWKCSSPLVLRGKTLGKENHHYGHCHLLEARKNTKTAFSTAHHVCICQVGSSPVLFSIWIQAGDYSGKLPGDHRPCSNLPALPSSVSCSRLRQGLCPCPRTGDSRDRSPPVHCSKLGYRLRKDQLLPGNNCTAAGEHENYWHEADLGLLWSRN